ncbi:helix-turn-helix transcriptional regulator [Paracoccus sp. (in: a-proteobacteria)]|uniref:helix-turn-helix transcriptional regulator n=1 Tax=Paracoccus sp. TaxID=267 RepID=UPI00396CCD38
MLPSYIERLLDARTITDIRRIFLEAAGQFGFDHALYVARFMLSVPASLLHEKPVVFSNLPDRLLEDSKNLTGLENDPLVQWVLTNDGTVSTADLIRHNRGVVPPSLLLAQRHDLGVCQIISLRDKVLHSAGAVALMPGKGADEDDLQRQWAQSGRQLKMLTWVMHMRVATMQRKPPAATLTPRQREVLGWRSAGKTVGEIATILGITPATVEKHMRLARESLGVETTPQAVLKAHVTHQLHKPTNGLRD